MGCMTYIVLKSGTGWELSNRIGVEHQNDLFAGGIEAWTLLELDRDTILRLVSTYSTRSNIIEMHEARLV